MYKPQTETQLITSIKATLYEEHSKQHVLQEEHQAW